MRSARFALTSTLVALWLLAQPAGAQVGIRAPDLRGVWNPVVGTGSVYQIERGQERKSEMEMAVVGEEPVDGKPGHWLEIAITDPRSGTPILMKQLVVRDGDRMETRRSIFQMPGRPPFEMPIPPASAAGTPPRTTVDVRKEAELVGTESITTPAGTFTCEHYRIRDGKGDVWIAQNVAPWGLVKMVSPDASMTLVRRLQNATTKVTGTPEKFDPAEMMRRQQQRRQ